MPNSPPSHFDGWNPTHNGKALGMVDPFFALPTWVATSYAEERPGDLLVNGTKQSIESLKPVIGFVPQADRATGADMAVGQNQ